KEGRQGGGVNKKKKKKDSKSQAMTSSEQTILSQWANVLTLSPPTAFVMHSDGVMDEVPLNQLDDVLQELENEEVVVMHPDTETNEQVIPTVPQSRTETAKGGVQASNSPLADGTKKTSTSSSTESNTQHQHQHQQSMSPSHLGANSHHRKQVISYFAPRKKSVRQSDVTVRQRIQAYQQPSSQPLTASQLTKFNQMNTASAAVTAAAAVANQKSPKGGKHKKSSGAKSPKQKQSNPSTTTNVTATATSTNVSATASTNTNNSKKSVTFLFFGILHIVQFFFFFLCYPFLSPFFFLMIDFIGREKKKKKKGGGDYNVKTAFVHVDFDEQIANTDSGSTAGNKHRKTSTVPDGHEDLPRHHDSVSSFSSIQSYQERIRAPSFGNLAMLATSIAFSRHSPNSSAVFYNRPGLANVLASRPLVAGTSALEDILAPTATNASTSGTEKRANNERTQDNTNRVMFTVDDNKADANDNLVVHKRMYSKRDSIWEGVLDINN
ncbi:ubiquitin system component Cue domain containing protein, partial [Reticulomyxa filosa]